MRRIVTMLTTVLVGACISTTVLAGTETPSVWNETTVESDTTLSTTVKTDGTVTDGVLEIKFDDSVLSCEKEDVVISDAVDMYSVNVEGESVKISFLAEDEIEEGALIQVTFDVLDETADAKSALALSGNVHDAEGKELVVRESETEESQPEESQPEESQPEESEAGETASNAPSTGNGQNTGNPVYGEITVDLNQENAWNDAIGRLNNVEVKGKLTVKLKGSATISKDFLEALKGQDKTVVFQLENGIKWSINGMSITGDVKDLNLDVTIGSSDIPEATLDKLANGRDVLEISIAYDGALGCEAVMTINVAPEHVGEYANLYYYNEKTGKLQFKASCQVDADGNVEFTFDHASDYAIIFDQTAVNAVATGDPFHVTMGVLVLFAGMLVVAFSVRKKKGW